MLDDCSLKLVSWTTNLSYGRTEISNSRVALQVKFNRIGILIGMTIQAKFMELPMDVDVKLNYVVVIVFCL